jgi:hypothetical protein
VFLKLSRKYKNFRKGVMQERIKPIGIEIINLVDKQTKVAYIYYLFYYYLRFIYRTLAIRFTIYKSKISKLKNFIFNFFRVVKYKKNKLIRKIKNKKVRMIAIESSNSFSYRFFNNMIMAFSNINIGLSTYLEQFGLYTHLRNIRKLTGSLRLSLDSIYKIRTYKLKKIIRGIRKYLWHYKKLILIRIHLRKFNFFVQCILLFVSAKLTLSLYLANYWYNIRTTNYTSWLVYMLSAYLSNLFVCFPFKQVNSLFIHICCSVRKLINKMSFINQVTVKQKYTADFYINIRTISREANKLINKVKWKLLKSIKSGFRY